MEQQAIHQVRWLYCGLQFGNYLLSVQKITEKGTILGDEIAGKESVQSWTASRGVDWNWSSCLFFPQSQQCHSFLFILSLFLYFEDSHPFLDGFGDSAFPLRLQFPNQINLLKLGV
jgi:hypothetical protein